MWLGFIGTDKAEAVWDCQHCEDLTNLKLNLQSSSSPGPAIGDVTPGLPKITLTALNPKESYQLWLEGLTTSGTAVKSNMLAFTTRADDEFNGKRVKKFAPNNLSNAYMLNLSCRNSDERFSEPDSSPDCEPDNVS